MQGNAEGEDGSGRKRQEERLREAGKRKVRYSRKSGWEKRIKSGKRDRGMGKKKAAERIGTEDEEREVEGDRVGK